MTEEALAVLGREGSQRRCQCGVQVLQVAGRRLAQVRFEFGKGQFNRVEIRAIGRQVTDAHSLGRENPGDVLDFVGGEVVEDDRIACAELRSKHLLKINREDLGINRAFDQKGGGDSFLAQGRNESGGLPVAVRYGAEAALPLWTASVVTGQLGVQTRFINKHQPAGIPAGLLRPPKPSGGFDIRPRLLGGARRFFYSSDPVVPDGATGR
jgi:hypothetical protein